MSPSVKIEMDAANKLTQEGKRLCVLRVVESKSKNGKPFVWYVTKCSDDTLFNLGEDYNAFILTGDIKEINKLLKDGSGHISMDSRPHVLGKKMVRNCDGSIVLQDGEDSSITITNNADQCYCGISENMGNEINPICYFTLDKGNTINIKPTFKIILLLENTEQTSMIEISSGPGIFIDCREDRKVKYQYDAAEWKAIDDGTYNKIDSGTNLISRLIDHPASSR